MTERITPRGETTTTSESGGMKGVKVHRFDQIPAEPMEELAARYGTGSMKYPQKDGIDNWRHGYEFSKSLAALERHLYAFKRGEDYDDQQYLSILPAGEDTIYDEDGGVRPGVTHLSAVIWHCMFILYHLEHNPQFDDRPTTVARRNAEKAQFGKAPELPKFAEGESDDEDGFTVARAKHRATVDDWHGKHPIGGGAATPEDRQAAKEVLAAWDGSKGDVDDPNPFAVYKATKSGLAPVKTADVWAHQKGIMVRDWDGIAPYEFVTEADFDKRVNGCTVALAARVDDWLQWYKIDFLAGDLGDTYEHVTHEEFEGRLWKLGNSWKMGGQQVKMQDRTIDFEGC